MRKPRNQKLEKVKEEVTFLTDADQERVRPKNTMKKKGPQRSQSLRAFPGSSRYGLGNTTSFKLLTILDKSRFTVSQTGSVSVLGGDPNPEGTIPGPLLAEGMGGGAGTDGGFCLEEAEGAGGGRFDWMNGEDETGIEARVGLGGLAGSTVMGPDWTLALIRFSISSMSDWEEGWSGTVSRSECDIFFECLGRREVWDLREGRRVRSRDAGGVGREKEGCLGNGNF